MAYLTPDVALEVSYENPGDPPVWEDETAYLRSFSYRRGRSDPRDPFEAGTATFTLDNFTGRFSPSNAAGPHYPNVRPMRRIRLRGLVDMGLDPFTVGDSYVGGDDVIDVASFDIPLWSGFVDSWPQEWPFRGLDADVVVHATDGFRVLNMTDFIWSLFFDEDEDEWFCGFIYYLPYSAPAGPPFIPDDVSGDRINRVLDCVGWPSEDRAIDTGTIDILGSIDGINIFYSDRALVHIQNVENTEGGSFFMDASGRATYHDASFTSVLDPDDTFSTDESDRLYSNIAVSWSEDRIFNAVRVDAGELGGVYETIDQTFIEAYFRRDITVSVLPSSVSVSDQADRFLAEFSDTKLTVDDFKPLARETFDWVYILSRELMDRVRIVEHPLGGEVLDMDCRLEEIQVTSGGRKDWNVTWTLSATGG